jgi:hypothetical protein
MTNTSLGLGKLSPEVIRKTHPRSILAILLGCSTWIKFFPRGKGWHWTLGLYSNIQHRHHSTLPIQNAPVNNQCHMVCYKPGPASRSAHPTRSNGLPGTDSRTSHYLECSPKPNHEIVAKPAEKPSPQTKVDVWWHKLRASQGTPPSSPSPNVITLAHRKRCIKFFWLLIEVK